jgi:hypothetical protein
MSDKQRERMTNRGQAGQAEDINEAEEGQVEERHTNEGKQRRCKH